MGVTGAQSWRALPFDPGREHSIHCPHREGEWASVKCTRGWEAPFQGLHVLGGPLGTAAPTRRAGGSLPSLCSELSGLLRTS